MKSIIKESLNKNKKWTISLAFFLGLVSDILEPLAPFSNYLFIFSIVFSFILLIIYIVFKKIRLKLFPIFMFLIFISFISGCLTIFQNYYNKSFLASNIPILEDFQFFLDKNIKEIKKTIKNVKFNTEQVLYTTQKIDKKIDIIIEKINVIDKPKTSMDFYSNARNYEIKGDYSKARRAYIKYFNFKENKIDPHLRFQKFLKIQEGIAGAREIYNEMFLNSNNLIDKYALILLETNKDKKLKLLIEFAKNNPEFGPVYYELSKIYSKKELGSQSLFDKKLEIIYINKFLQLYENGKVTKYFIDQEEINKQLKYANEIKKRLSKININIFENPIKISRFFHDERGWTINIYIADKANKILYRFDGKGSFIETGYISNYMDNITGRPVPNYYFNIAYNEPKEYIEFKYEDINGKEQGPFKINWINKTIDGKKIEPKVDSAIYWIKITTKDYWITIKNNKLYFSFMGGPWANIALEKVMYGINTNIPNIEFKPPFIHNNKNYILYLNKDFKFFVLQLYFKDGTKSEIKTYKKLL